MPRAVDFHVDLPISELMDVAIGQYRDAVARSCRVDVKLRAVRELGLSGAKFHPGVQAFYPNDPRFAPLFQKISELGIPALFHTGTNGLGAGMPGGGGIKLDHTRPIYLDSLAADFPDLTII